MALYVGCSAPHTLAGILCLSGYLPNPSGVTPSPAALSTPVRFLHGDADAVVPLDFAKDALERVLAMGFHNATMKVHRGLGHGASEASLRDVATWLRERLPPLRNDGSDAVASGGRGGRTQPEL